MVTGTGKASQCQGPRTLYVQPPDTGLSFWTMPPSVNTTLGDHTHMQCENGSGPTQRQYSQSSHSPAQLWQAALSGGCVTLTSVLSCPAADINTWHISQISPIKQDNSLQLQMVFPARMCVFQIFMVFTKLRSPFHLLCCSPVSVKFPKKN